ncbi:MAG TPA: ATP-binding protein [Myxococcales bacterium]|nr:ATP-binding protein [Myxococcales bacterium]
MGLENAPGAMHLPTAQTALQQSEARLRSAVNALTRLHAISRQLGAMRTRRDVAELVVREAILESGAASAAAYLAPEDGGSARLLFSSRPERSAAPDARGIDARSPGAEALAAAAPIYLAGPAEVARYPNLESRPGAIAALPLLVEKVPVGALVLEFTAERVFDGPDREFLEALAQTFAQALERARLLESEQRARRSTERYADRIQRLLRITAALAQSLSPDDVAEAVIDEAARATDAVSGGLWLIEGGALELVRSIGLRDAPGRFDRIALDGTRDLPVITAVRARETMFIERDDELARWPEIANPGVSVETHGPLAVVPLIAQGRALGAIAYRYRPARRIDDDERAVLMMISRYAAQALERARLYESERRARQAAEASEARAVEADRRKDEFLAMLGHELRNPLAPIVTALQLMRLRDASAHDRERAVIERQVQHLMRLVDDLLDVSRITRGRIQLRLEPLDVKGIVAKAVEMASPLFEARAHRLDVRLPQQPLPVRGDAARLAQALSNILNNAAKYTEPGGAIFVHAERQDGEILIRVRDNGIGIAQAMLPRVFDLFTQEPRSLDRSQGGLGVGLTIVRSLIELHGGKVTAFSEGAGRGSEFEIRLPAAKKQRVEDGDGAKSMPPQRDAAAARVLIVDDNVDAASVLADALSHLGYSTAVAHDGPSGLLTARTFQPRVILLDIGLPVMDGYELASRLRAEAGSGMPALVAITGYGQSADKQRAETAGFSEHLVKPVDLNTVLAVVGRLTGERSAP